MNSDGSVVEIGSCKIPLHELQFEFARSSGPGGQNVNKLETKATIRFDFLNSPSIPPGLKQRAFSHLENQLTDGGELLVSSQRSSSQWQNRADCIAKFKEMLTEAFRPPKIRRATKPTRSSKTKRLDSKRHHGDKKKHRRPPNSD